MANSNELRMKFYQQQKLMRQGYTAQEAEDIIMGINNMGNTIDTKNKCTITKNGELCGCGKYHYNCEVCGSDCTKGKEASPAVTFNGITRCRKCHDAFWSKKMILEAAAPDLLDAAKDVLSHYNRLYRERVEKDDAPAHMQRLIYAINKAEGK